MCNVTSTEPIGYPVGGHEHVTARHGIFGSINQTQGVRPAAPNGILPEHAEIDYELADSTSQRMKTYKLDIMMSNAQGNIVNNWHRDIVAVEAGNSAECLSGIGLFRRGCTATNPQGGPAARNF